MRTAALRVACRPEGRRSLTTGLSGRLAMRGFDRLSAVDASQRLALRGIPAVLLRVPA
ncbi:MAG: hypothetical protein OXE58_01185 [Acidobacteria bacterium]|nr:hypothetical protein [Acidobacteriota bacterium]